MHTKIKTVIVYKKRVYTQGLKIFEKEKNTI